MSHSPSKLSLHNKNNSPDEPHRAAVSLIIRPHGTCACVILKETPQNLNTGPTSHISSMFFIKYFGYWISFHLIYMHMSRTLCFILHKFNKSTAEFHIYPRFTTKISTNLQKKTCRYCMRDRERDKVKIDFKNINRLPRVSTFNSPLRFLEIFAV